MAGHIATDKSTSSVKCNFIKVIITVVIFTIFTIFTRPQELKLQVTRRQSSGEWRVDRSSQAKECCWAVSALMITKHKTLSSLQCSSYRFTQLSIPLQWVVLYQSMVELNTN